MEIVPILSFMFQYAVKTGILDDTRDDVYTVCLFAFRAVPNTVSPRATPLPVKSNRGDPRQARTPLLLLVRAASQTASWMAAPGNIGSPIIAIQTFFDFPSLIARSNALLAREVIVCDEAPRRKSRSIIFSGN